MAFYTAAYLKRLLKEEHKDIQAHITKTGNDFRSFIDSTLPFTLYLDIDIIKKEILNPNAEFIVQLSKLMSLEDPNVLIKELESTYKRLINSFASSYPAVTSEELQNTFNEFNIFIDKQKIKQGFDKFFKDTVHVSNLYKKDRSILLIFPRFRTISDVFGKKFKNLVNYDTFSDLIDDDLGDSPQNIFRNYLNKNFGQLQNIGHVEVDVLSSTSNEVKRGLVSPRLLQALVELPSGVSPEKLAKQFSTTTGQADTRIIIRKKFAGSKLVLELLIENGFSVGSLESRKTNLTKAALEKAFPVGANLTRKLIADKSILANLETSKSITGYLVEEILSLLKTGKSTKPYTSESSITQSTKVQVPVVKPVNSRKTSSPTSLPNLPRNQKSSGSLITLEALLRLKLQEQVRKNMGRGLETRVLNYRSGRFVESVGIERLTKSKQGLITAYYRYQKNPYATFSEGGKQQYPRTRDPKLLISKSIKELAYQLVKDRLRAVVV